MTRRQRQFQAGALLLFAAAAGYLLLLLVAFSGWAIFAIAMSAAHFALGIGVMRGWRFAGYGAFVIALLGAVVTFGAALPEGGLLRLLFWILLGVEVVTAALLLGLLWNNPRADSV
ncbi:MAG: hypothetical protein CML55_04215 [Rhodobacteraceae bacterium]|nr:hypothetical protein [Paracoccaceae bacterium]MBO29204.1 hypothetical protein [Paracoccaceae bacterium]